MRAPISFLGFLVVPALLLMLATPALATHARPKGAGVFFASLVPAYQQCSAPDRVHGPPLSFGSCSPAQTSQYLTVGTPDANGAAPKSVGSLRWTVYPGLPGPPHDTQTYFQIRLTDIRCTAATTTCGSANAVGGADYTGEVAIVLTLRTTDHWNAVNPGGGTEPGTMTDQTFGFWVPCSATADATVGSSCTRFASPSGYIPGFDPEGRRSIWELAQAQVYDGGADGVGSSAGDNTLFAVQGIFVP